MNTALATETNSGILQKQAQTLGVDVLPMPETIEGKESFEGVHISDV